MTAYKFFLFIRCCSCMPLGRKLIFFKRNSLISQHFPDSIIIAKRNSNHRKFMFYTVMKIFTIWKIKAKGTVCAYRNSFFRQKICDHFIIACWQILFFVHIIISGIDLNIIHGATIQIPRTPFCQYWCDNEHKNGHCQRNANQCHCFCRCCELGYNLSKEKQVITLIPVCRGFAFPCNDCAAGQINDTAYQKK